MLSLFKPLLSLLLVAVFLLPAQAESRREYTKTIKKEFGIHQDGTTSITNKYGKVKLHTWDKSRVKVEVTIIVDASNEGHAQNVFDRIEIIFYNTSSRVSAETRIESKSGKWWNWNNSNDKETDYEINYTVYLPTNNSIEINNRYGDLYVDAINGRADIEVKYGNFKLDGIGNDAKIDLGYGSGIITRARDIRASIKYSKLNLGNASDLNGETKYSQITVGDIGDMRLVSKYDNYDIDRVNNLHIDECRYGTIDVEVADRIMMVCRYTNLVSKKVTTLLDLDMSYGSAKVEALSEKFEQVNLDGRYTDFKIGIERGTNYTLNASADYAGIRYPSIMQVAYERDEGTSHEVRGENGNKGGVIRARLEYGGLKIY